MLLLLLERRPAALHALPVDVASAEKVQTTSLQLQINRVHAYCIVDRSIGDANVTNGVDEP